MRNISHDDVTNITITFHRNTERRTCNYSHSLTSKATSLACIDLCFLAFRRPGIQQNRPNSLSNNDQAKLQLGFYSTSPLFEFRRRWRLSLLASLRLVSLSESAYHERICLYARTDPSRFSSFDQVPLVFTLSSSEQSRKTFGTFASLKLLFRSIFHMLLFTLVLPSFPPRIVHVRSRSSLSSFLKCHSKLKRELSRFNWII